MLKRNKAYSEETNKRLSNLATPQKKRSLK
jgi:hypothetical protein